MLLSLTVQFFKAAFFDQGRRKVFITGQAKINAKQKHLGCKKGKANQKQQLSDYGYIAILTTESFDIKLRPRIS